MGQKVNPIGFRLEAVKNSPEWQSSWFANSKNILFSSRGQENS